MRLQSNCIAACSCSAVDRRYWSVTFARQKILIVCPSMATTDRVEIVESPALTSRTGTSMKLLYPGGPCGHEEFEVEREPVFVDDG